MKKLYILFILFCFSQLAIAQSKISVTFFVDVSSYLGNVPIKDSNIKIGGNFTDAGSIYANWDALASPQFKLLKDKVFYTTIEFDTAGIGRDLNYKFIISPDDWGTCGALIGPTQECIHPDSSCRQIQDDYRRLVIPSSNSSVGYLYNTCQLISPNLSVSNNKPLANLSLLPNPANEEITLQYILLNNEFVEIDLLNHLGQKIKNIQSGNQISGVKQIHIDLSNLENGNYFIKMNTSKGVFMKQFVKS